MDNQIISIDYDNQTVSARELYDAVSTKTERFSSWFKRQLQYGFVEGEDFTGVKNFTVVNNGAKKPLQDYSLSIDMAKHICMVQKNDKAKQIRQYLIDLEKAWNTPEQVMARALKLADKTIENLKEQNKLILIEKQQIETQKEQAEQKIEQDKPLVDFAHYIANMDELISIGQFAKLLNNNKVEMGRGRLFKYLREEKILMGDNTPYQNYIDNGYFKVKEVYRYNQYGKKFVYPTTFITGKGQLWLHKTIIKSLGIEVSLKLKDETDVNNRIRDSSKNNKRIGADNNMDWLDLL